MNRSLAAILALFVLPVVPATSYASSRDGLLSPGAGGGSIFRMHGGTVHPDAGRGAGPGWLAGGAVGFPVKRDFLILFGYDHLAVDRQGVPKEDIGAMTAQLELAKPFQGPVMPRLNVGAGVYLRSVETAYYTYPYYPYAYRESRTDAPLGLNVGGGISFLLSKMVMLDLDAHYHQTVGRESSKTLLTTVTAGLTFALSKEEPDSGEYVQSRKHGDAAYASR